MNEPTAVRANTATDPSRGRLVVGVWGGYWARTGRPGSVRSDSELQLRSLPRVRMTRASHVATPGRANRADVVMIRRGAGRARFRPGRLDGDRPAESADQREDGGVLSQRGRGELGDAAGTGAARELVEQLRADAFVLVRVGDFNADLCATTASLADLSPWPDWRVFPLEEVLLRLRAQRHRRFIKTHTPLDGLPLDLRVRYIVVVRHPLDAAVSMYHQHESLNRQRVRRLTGNPEPAGPVKPPLPLRDWLLAWIAGDADPGQRPDSLPGVLHHLTDAWQRRGAYPARLVHYDDLRADLGGQMRAQAAWLDIHVAEQAWPELVAAAGFSFMRARADQLAPASGILKDNTAFFRRGRFGAAAELLSEAHHGHLGRDPRRRRHARPRRAPGGRAVRRDNRRATPVPRRPGARRMHRRRDLLRQPRPSLARRAGEPAALSLNQWTGS
jgi:aryl sulfotransferase